MNLAPEQVEWIVQEVIRRLRAQGATIQLASSAQMLSKTAMESSSEGTMALTDRVVTTHVLAGRLSGVQSIRIGSRTVVTPSAKDMLRDCGVEVIRGK